MEGQITRYAWWIHDYPEDIQEEYFKTHERVPSKFFTKTVLVRKGFALLVTLAVMLGLIPCLIGAGIYAGLLT